MKIGRKTLVGMVTSNLRKKKKFLEKDSLLSRSKTPKKQMDDDRVSALKLPKFLL